MKIPFNLMPASWGLKGKSRKIAEAEYYLKDYDLAIRLAEIEHEDNPKQLAVAKLDVDFKYNKIDEYNYDVKLATLTTAKQDLEHELLTIECHHGRIEPYDCLMAQAELKFQNTELELAKAKIDFDYEKLSKVEYDMKCATIRNEAFIGLKDSSYNPEEKLNGLYFEFIWNDQWIDALKEAGYVGFTEDQIVERWFNDICSGVTAEQVAAAFENDPVPFNSRGFVNVTKNGDDPTTSYS